MAAMYEEEAEVPDCTDGGDEVEGILGSIGLSLLLGAAGL
jgi:hypothetical protein